MNAVKNNFLKFLQGTKQFIIPIYQRNYSWTTKQCQQLWNDIMRAATDPKINGHFMGSIVYVESGLYQVSSVPQLLVIDGQQRLTTLSLLLAALGREIGESKVADDITQRKINHYYLFNSEEDKDLRYKLLLTRSDKDTLISILESSPELPTTFSHHMIENYEFFKEQMQSNEVDLGKLYQGIQKLFIVDISLDRNYDNPQLIFESLNSTGLDLSQADLIRNYVLMGLEPKEQERIYNEYWYPMERSFEQVDYAEYFDRFMRDFLTIETGQIPNIGDVYSNFKSYVVANSKDVSIREIVQKIYHYAKLYVKLLYGKNVDDIEIKEAIGDIRDLKVEVSYPFLLEVLDDHMKGRLTRDELLSIIRLVESYVFRRAICQIPTNSLNKTFANLAKEIDKDKYFESLRAAFILKDGYTRIPTDEEFQAQFPIVPIYNLRIKEYVLGKLENFNHKKEPIDVAKYTLEHIMPQNKNLLPEWRQDLGEDWEQVHQKYLHTIGNLTITGYNSELSDRPFLEKRDIPGGFSLSPFWLNRSLVKLEHWNKEEIERRAQQLTGLATQIWPAPQLPPSELEKYKVTKNRVEEQAYTEEDHLRHGDDNARRLYNLVKAKVLEMGGDSSNNNGVKINPVRNYIGFAKNKNFIAIRIRKNFMTVDLVTQDGFQDPKGISVQAFKTHYGGRIRRVRVANEAIIPDLMDLIKQMYAKA